MTMRAFKIILIGFLLMESGCDRSPPMQQINVGTDAGTDTDADTDSDSDTEQPPPSTWTIMMYEDADNNLEEVLLQDVNEAELSDIPDNVNIIVLLDRAEGYSTTDGDWTGAKLFRLQHDEEMGSINSERLADPDFLGLTANSSNGEELDMASGETLEKFIDFCKSSFPAEGYILHFSDHGDGWSKGEDPTPEERPLFKGMCSDDSSGNSMSISHDLPGAIEGKDLLAVSFDACLMGAVEIAWAVKDHVDFMSASVMSVPGTGWEYTRTLNNWFEDMTARRWVAASVEEFEAYYQGESNVGFSAVDLRPMNDLGDALADFLDDADGLNMDDLKSAKDNSVTPQWMGWDGMIDFVDFISNCGSLTGGDSAQNLLYAFDEMVVTYWYSDDLPDIGPLSIYAPTEIFGWGSYDSAYDETPFALDTDWEDFIIPLV